ncbi:NTP transferase domain-containing protein [Helicobacter sp. MIT 11-5569]|uniref:NTP transferase domain-containing protein n=1 Tax=Helicobacter sp. MIT 11-5569 TaxID=1548151 RepID=UPI000A8E5199|nr:NTP transferase domain-containing protein [Helicobacter sp. MIT 11-5569]
MEKDLEKFAMPCVILSGGVSRRMGRLKQDLPFLDSTLANFQAKRLKDYFDSVYFSAKTPIVNAFLLPTILDSTLEINAPIFGLKSVLEELKSDVFVLSIDAPFFDDLCIKSLMQAFVGKGIFAKNTKIHPLLGIYPFSALEIINAQIHARDYKLMHLLEKIEADFVAISEDKTRNLNTPKDYAEACEFVEIEG